MLPIHQINFLFKLQNIPLLVVLIVPFVLLTAIAVGLTAYFSFRNGQQAVYEVTAQLQREIIVQIEQELETLPGDVSNDVFPSHISNFLRNLTAGKNGAAFIVERSGLLVASSTGENLFVAAENGQPPQRPSAGESNTPLVQAGVAQLVKQFGSLETITGRQDFEFDINGQRYLTQVVPFHRAPQPDWLVVVAIPEADFIAPIQANTRQTIWFILAALGLAIAAGIITARQVSQPLLNLNNAAKLLARGAWTRPLRFDHIKEINELSQSFNTMAAQLTQSLERMAAEIAERKQAEEKIVASEQRFRALIEKSTDVIVLLNARGDIVYESPSGLHITGYSAEERIGRSGFDLIHPDDLDNTRRLFADLMQKPGADVSAQLRSRRKDGNWRWLEVTATNLLADPGVQAVVVNYRDITERKQAEKSLQELSVAVNASGDIVFMTDKEGIITSVNSQFTNLYGYSQEEMVGKVTPRILRSDRQSQEVYEQFWETILRGELFGGEVVNKSKDGRLIFIEETVSPFLDDHGRIAGFLAIQRDITARKQAEESLQQAEAKYRALVENIPAVVYMDKADESSSSYYISPQIETLLGYPPSAYAEDPTLWHKQIDPRDYQRAVRTIQETLEQSQAVAEYRLITPDGRVVWVRDSSVLIRDRDGRPEFILGFLEDITELKQAEEELKHQAEILQTIIDNIPIMIELYDSHGQLVLVNREWQRVLGWTLAEAQAHPDIMAALYPDPEYRHWVLKCMALAEPGWHEFKTTLRDGQTLDTAWTDVRLSNGASIGIGQDISQRKQMEERLHQVQKMEAIGRLAGGVAHDFNNILVPIIGYAELGMLKLTPEDDLYTDFTRIREAADRAAGLTRQILAFSRQQMLEIQTIDLNAVVEGFKQMLQRLIGEDIELQTFLTPALYPVKADKGQMEQVLMNLAINARDAMPRGGKLTIETANVYLDEAYVEKYAGAQTPGHYARLSVSDTGHGMDAETRKQIFEPFFTTKEQGKGTGLGLATVFGIVKQHEGNIWVYSEPGSGATFKIYLPKAEKPGQTLDTAAPEPAFTDGTETILVVEDEEMTRRLVCETLAARGYKVFEAQSPTDALQLVSRRTETIHLLLTDIIMPEMNGRELYQKAAAIQPELRVLYMSGYTDNAIVHHSVLDEGVNFLQKPFTIQSLAQKVRQVLG